MQSPVIQITDCHLSSGGGLFGGIDPNRSLTSVVDLIRHNHPHAGLLIATGDISNDETHDSYGRFIQQTDQLQFARCWLPGNHDDPGLMQKVSARDQVEMRSTQLGSWTIVLLDSHVAGAVHGHLDATELKFLSEKLRSFATQHVLIAIHHHVIPVDCPWMDKSMLDNANELFESLNVSDKVRGIIFGHVHQELDVIHEGVRLLGCPSTSIQFKPHTTSFTVDEQTPGYRWLELGDDGTIDTGVCRT